MRMVVPVVGSVSAMPMSVLPVTMGVSVPLST